MKRLFIISAAFFVVFIGKAQTQDSLRINPILQSVQLPDTIIDSLATAHLITFSYAYQMPGGDMATRFRNNSSIGGGYYYKTKRNVLIGAEGHFIFGGKPKEVNMLDSIRIGKTSDGNIIDANGQYADVRMYERGYDLSVKIGKVFKLKSANTNSGLFFTAGAGFLQHKIRIESMGNRAPQLTKEYRAGYDRMANGLMLAENVGYFYMGENKMTNFYLALEMVQGFTNGKRYNFDTMMMDDASRLDLLFGLRLGWMIPVQSQKADEFYF
jgi:hypothetical protein